MNRCPVCGEKVKKGETHCSNCGTNLYALSQKESNEPDIEQTVVVKKTRFERKQIITIACLVVFLVCFIGYRVLNHVSNEEQVADLEVEDISFKNAVEELDEKAKALKEIVETEFNIEETISYEDTVSDDQTVVEYKGTYKLEDASEFSYTYRADQNTNMCTLKITHTGEYDQLEDYNSWVVSYEDVVTEMIGTVCTETISSSDFEDSIMDYYNRYIEDSNTDNFVQVGKNYGMIYIEEGDTYQFELELYVENCEVVY